MLNAGPPSADVRVVREAREDERDKITCYAVQHDLEGVEWFEDLDLFRRADERPELQAMLLPATDDDVDAIVFCRLERFSPGPLHFCQLAHSLSRAEAEFRHAGDRPITPTQRCSSSAGSSC